MGNWVSLLSLNLYNKQEWNHFSGKISSIGEDQGVAGRALLRDICQMVAAVEHNMSL